MFVSLIACNKLIGEKEMRDHKKKENKNNLNQDLSKQERVKLMKSLFGSVPNIYGEEVLKERLKDFD